MGRQVNKEIIKFDFHDIFCVSASCDNKFTEQSTKELIDIYDMYNNTESESSSPVSDTSTFFSGVHTRTQEQEFGFCVYQYNKERFDYYYRLNQKLVEEAIQNNYKWRINTVPLYRDLYNDLFNAGVLKRVHFNEPNRLFVPEDLVYDKVGFLCKGHNFDTRLHLCYQCNSRIKYDTTQSFLVPVHCCCVAFAKSGKDLL